MLLYCVIAPNVYEATARVALRGTQVSLLTLDRNEGAPSGSFASGQVQLETLANVLRSDQLAWDVISRLQLYKAPGFKGSFAQKFTDFSANQPSPDGRDWLARSGFSAISPCRQFRARSSCKSGSAHATRHFRLPL